MWRLRFGVSNARATFRVAGFFGGLNCLFDDVHGLHDVLPIEEQFGAPVVVLLFDFGSQLLPTQFVGQMPDRSLGRFLTNLVRAHHFANFDDFCVLRESSR